MRGRSSRSADVRKVVAAAERLAGDDRPVVEERRLQLAHDRPLESRAGVAPAVRMFGIAAPHIVDSVAERVADPAIDHRKIAVIDGRITAILR